LHDVGSNYLVMELIEEESPQGPLPLELALRYARQIADALDYAHAKGIVHRDLKPGNIKVTPEGVVKVLDFRLAKTASPSDTDLENSPTLSMAATQAGVILGTAAYMAPEQAKGKSVDKRADIWAFGVVLYEMITGERLFKGADTSEILASVIKEKPDLTAVPDKIRPKCCKAAGRVFKVTE
jgi:serine/threonine protein kinase